MLQNFVSHFFKLVLSVYIHPPNTNIFNTKQ